MTDDDKEEKLHMSAEELLEDLKSVTPIDPQHQSTPPQGLKQHPYMKALRATKPAAAPPAGLESRIDGLAARLDTVTALLETVVPKLAFAEEHYKELLGADVIHQLKDQKESIETLKTDWVKLNALLTIVIENASQDRKESSEKFDRILKQVEKVRDSFREDTAYVFTGKDVPPETG